MGSGPLAHPKRAQFLNPWENRVPREWRSLVTVCELLATSWLAESVEITSDGPRVRSNHLLTRQSCFSQTKLSKQQAPLASHLSQSAVFPRFALLTPSGHDSRVQAIRRLPQFALETSSHLNSGDVLTRRGISWAPLFCWVPF